MIQKDDIKFVIKGQITNRDSSREQTFPTQKSPYHQEVLFCNATKKGHQHN